MKINKIKKIVTIALMAVSLISVAPISAYATPEEDKAFIETCKDAKDLTGITSTYEKNGKIYKFTNGEIKRNYLHKNYYAKEDGTLAKNEWAYITHASNSIDGGFEWVSAWRYFGNDYHPVIGEQIIDGKKYFFAKNGDLRTGWFKTSTENDKYAWFYAKEDGSLEAGWVQSGNDWYYVNSDGQMLKNTTIDGCTLDKNGRWVK